MRALAFYVQGNFSKETDVITGYKTQRAWIADPTSDRGVFGRRADKIYSDESDLLLRGHEVEGFKWIDLPIVEGV